jgi:lipopolysaccharide biosynthesis regulator YciM
VVALPIAFVLGWLASRLDIRQLRIENRQAPKAYFKGLNFLLNEQQDQAIDAFIEAVQSDPDTSELHFALGNLFRRRGEYERAVRVHQHLLSRGDLAQDERDRAQYALALDFLKAGLLDRAETALLALEGTRFSTQSHLALLANYERARDWLHAAAIAQKLESAGQGSFKNRQAHYLCEQAAAEKTDIPAATALLDKAIAIAPESARAYMDLAALQQQQGDTPQAYATLMHAMVGAPAAIALIAPQLAKLASAANQAPAALAALQTAYAQTLSLDVLEALVSLEAQQPASLANAKQRYAQHLEKEPSLVAAAQWIAADNVENPHTPPYVYRALEHATKPLTRYRCAACGFEAKRHFWQCPGCQAWDSYPARRVEEL